jgi:hypothetical protein
LSVAVDVPACVEDGEVVSKKKDESGPWNKLAAAGIQQTDQVFM